MSNRIPSTPRPQSQSEADTETGRLVSSSSASEQSSASEDDSEKSAQAPVMKTRQASAQFPTNNRWDQFTKAVTADGKLNLEIFDENGMSEFVAWLQTSPSSLRELYFRNSGIGSAHAIDLAEALRGNTTLRKLEVRGYLGEEGAAAVADALKVNTNLTELDISCDFIGNEGAKALADALKINKTLTKLQLFAYMITEEGEKAMVEALRVNETLTSLTFSPTLIGQFDTETSNLLERNKRLKLIPYAEASLDLLVRHSPALKGMDGLKDVLPLVTEHLSTEVMAIFGQELNEDFRAPSPPITTTTTNTTTTTTTTATTDSTIPTTLITSPAATATSPASVPPLSTQPSATAADINALLADPNPVIAVSRWIDRQANPVAALNWVDPTNGYTLLHYAVVAQQGAVVRSLVARGIDSKKADQNNQTAAQLAQQLAGSSASRTAAAIAALFK